ncbi:MAG: DNA topoisomerase 3 [Paludibacteraceae bacterium]|nr:DNA topoisomerase 3 [Paludibacteraceae bacterium]
MIVCIAEKPSVGRYIANVLGATQQHDGYNEGNGYQVTWTFGHLCALLDPEEYTPQWKGWNMSSLPMVPQQFGIKVTKDSGVQKQFHIIQNLMQNADMIINCGDAGQEGELIQRWVMQKAGAHCPVKRLWVSSLTEEAIREGFSNLKDQSEYQKLYEAGLMRAIGDWLLGMNATRAYTLRYQERTSAGTKKQPLSIGRVQTPTLALIVQRQWEIDHFTPRTYWELKTLYRGVTFNAIIRKSEEELLGEIQKAEEEAQKAAEKGKNKGKTIEIPTLDQLQKDNIGIDAIPSAEEGQALCERIQQHPFIITKVEKKKGLEYAPRLFDLTSLQVECNRKYGFSADKTLQLIQSLYEKQLTTYPRVDTTFLSDDIYPKVPGIIKGLEPYFPQVNRLRELMKAEQERTGKAPQLPKSKKVFDNSKVTDHHAIIPTGRAPITADADEKKVYQMVALRFLAAFYPECQISTTTVFGQVENIPFKIGGKQILVPGWREVFSTAKSEKAENTDDTENAENTDTGEQSTLPDFVVGEQGPHTPSLIEKQTTPPKPYTEATLLRAMETAGKMVENEELRDLLKENGIGRPSTRAAMIEKLFQRKYIVRKGKSLYPTTVGTELIRTIHTPLLKSAELTGQWEKKLRMIERGEMEAKPFLDELKQLTAEVVYEVKTSKIGLLCPVCRQGRVIRGNTAYGCSRWQEGCTYREPLPGRTT